jgi:hypothetical protein
MLIPNQCAVFSGAPDGSSGGNLSLPAMVLHTEGMSGIIAEDMATI